MKNWLDGKFVLLSGASSGIGKEVCKLLVTKYNAKVLGIGRSEEKMQRLTEELGEYSNNFCYRLFDVSRQAGWELLAQELKEKNMTPDLLINNAGTFPAFARCLEIPAQTVERVMAVNYLSSVYASGAILPLNADMGMVNVCSSSALCSVVGTAPYSASKKAMQGFTEALQMEEKGRYIGILYPGTTATELFREDENTKNSALDIVAMPAEKMARKIVKAILRRKKRCVLGWDAKAMAITAKIAPVTGLVLIAWVMKISGSKVFQNVFRR